MKEYRLTDWLPTTKKEVELRGWDELDVILFSGDAYVDHPSFGAAVIGHHPPTQLARRLARLQKTGTSPSVLRHQSRLYGFDGQQIYCQQTLAQ